MTTIYTHDDVRPWREHYPDREAYASPISCGVGLLYFYQYGDEKDKNNVRHLREVMKGKGTAPSETWCTFVFSDSVRGGRGGSFARYVREHGLGKLWETDEIENTNSGNTIQTWVWHPDYEKIRAHIDAIDATARAKAETEAKRKLEEAEKKKETMAILDNIVAKPKTKTWRVS